MSHLYITSHGMKIGIEGGRIVVSSKEETVRSIPKESVESISIFGNSHLTAKCIQFVLSKGISVSFFSSKGTYFGRLESTSHHRTSVLKKQFQMTDDMEFSIIMGRKMISAKIRNQEVILRRYIKEMTPEMMRHINLMKVYRTKAEHAGTIEELMGYEGIAARNYFDCILLIINPEFRFSGRTRRPPEDPFNSMLSLGYTLLMYEIYSKIEDEGMSPYYALVHKSYKDNPALASDLMEEWRGPVVDSVVLSMIQGNEVHADDFEYIEENGSVIMTKECLNKFVKKFEKRMNMTIKYLLYDDKTYTIRDALSKQCRQLRNCFVKGTPDEYIPVIIR